MVFLFHFDWPLQKPYFHYHTITIVLYSTSQHDFFAYCVCACVPLMPEERSLDKSVPIVQMRWSFCFIIPLKLAWGVGHALVTMTQCRSSQMQIGQGMLLVRFV